MSFSRTIRLTNRLTGEQSSQTVEFSDAEWATLRQFAAHADALAATKYVQDGMPGTFQWHFEEGKGAWTEADLPSDDVLAAALHRLRHVFLEEEPASFVKAAAILGRRVSVPEYRQLLKRIRRVYDGKRLESMFYFQVSDLELNTPQTFRDWINAYEYHGDPEKRARFDAVSDLIPAASLRAFLLNFLREAIDATMMLRRLVRAFESGNGFEVDTRDLAL